ncbi:MAG: putative glycoside hydrolase [bacterium]|nr:putative glycoside hydrolase [bacterium]
MTKRISFSKNLIYYNIFLLAIVISAGVILFSWKNAVNAIDTTSTPWAENFVNEIVRVKPEKQIAKGVYLTAYSAGSPKKLDQIISLIDKTELNAVVIDIKDYSGKILYNSRLPLVKKLKLKENRLTDLKKIIEKLHAHQIYVIARQTVFQDPLLATVKPEWAIKKKSGGIWHDRNGLAWVDATKQEVWDYNIDIAKEAIALGFDEVNFDYVRFPSDGNMSQVVYTNKIQKKYEVMGDFYKYLGEQLADEPAWISIDMFGFVMEKKGTDDMNIGQRLADAVGAVDYISPMMYPSHYGAGHLGLKNPSSDPGKVINNGMNLGQKWFTDARAEVRPWLQAFNIGAVYGADKIRAQISAVEKYPNAGWLLWNAANRYTGAGLKLETFTTTTKE